MQIAVIGIGYVGLVSGACFAAFGHHVVCFDRNLETLASLADGVIPFFEPDLPALVKENVEGGTLRFVSDIRDAVSGAQVVFITVGTPQADDGSADTSAVYEVVETLAPLVDKKTVLAIKSTVPIGTSDDVDRLLKTQYPGSTISVVSNPEFLREGSALQDFRLPDRIIIGSEDTHARNLVCEIYKPLLSADVPFVFCRRRNAELIKYAANAFLATKLTFINEIADLCEKLDGDIQDVSRGIGLDSRIGSKFLSPGPGFGGSCFPKDSLALVKKSTEYASPLQLVRAVVSANELRKEIVSKKVVDALGGKVKGARVAVLGLSFKPDTDDVRYSPSISLIRTLTRLGAKIRAYDPAGMVKARSCLEEVTFCEDPYSCASNADALAIVTDWQEFKELDLCRLKNEMAHPVVVDFRNLYSPQEMRLRGFTYISLGRSDIIRPAEEVRMEPNDFVNQDKVLT